MAKSIIAYLSANDKHVTSDTLRKELGLDENVFTADVTKKYENLLEKKWTSTVRLQRKAGNCAGAPYAPSVDIQARYI